MIKFPDLHVGGWHFVGVSIAGVSTSIVVPELNVVFDVAQGLPPAYHVGNLLVTHAHMDHAGGIPYLIAHKMLTSQPPVNIFVPQVMVDPIHKILKLWQDMEDYTYKYNLIGVKSGDSFPLKPEFSIKPFQTVHRIPSVGYSIFQTKKKLKQEFNQLKQHEIIALKKNGTEIEDKIEEPIISYTGDTQIEFLDQCSWVKDSHTLIMETTYIDNKKSIESTRQWGHTHLDELLSRIDELNCRHLIFNHLSARYHSLKEIQETLRKKMPEQWRDRTFFFKNRFQTIPNRS